MAQDYSVQVSDGHYDFMRYAAKPRFCSYWHQISEVAALAPKTLLVIGKGDGIVTDIIRRACEGIRITTFDYDASLSPDIVGDICTIGETVQDHFDCILCCQVLEHVEYKHFSDILRQLATLSDHVVMSIPCQCRTFGIQLDLPKLHVGKFWYPEKLHKTHVFDGQHYWEAGTRGYSKKKIAAAISEHFAIQKSFHVPEKPWHLFYILKKRG